MGLVFLKGTLAQLKTVAGLSSYDTEGPWQVWRKSDSWFPIQPRKKSANFPPVSQRVEISNLMGWFFLKVTLLEQKTVAGVSSCDTERLCKVWGKSDYWFPIQARKKSVNFVPLSQRVEISNLMRLVFLKGKLVQPKTLARVSFYDTERPSKVWGKSDYWFPIEPKKKSVNFVPGSQRVKISTLMGLFFVKGTLLDPKTVAGVSSCDTERPWEVWGKSDYRFPIRTRKKSVNFVPESQRIKI